MTRMIDVDLLIAAFEKVYPLATNEMGGVVNKRIYDIINSIPVIPESPNDPSGDYISRNALREAIFYHDYSPCKIDENANEIMRQARIIIDNAPTVEAYTSEDIVKYVSATEDLVREKLERPKGEWVYQTDIAFFTCSKCNGIGYIRDKFCKHCGAEMQGGAE